MEAVLVAQQATTAAAAAVRPGLAPLRDARRAFARGSPRRVSVAAGLGARRLRGLRAAVRAQGAAAVVEKTAGESRSPAERTPQLFVGLPLNVVSDCNTLNNVKAIVAGLRPLKLLGVDGVDLPVWWGVVEKESAGSYNWSSYLELVRMVRAAGLKVRVSLCFHSSKAAGIDLPSWVTAAGAANPDIYFADKEGRRQKECLSLAVDELPVLDGRTPLRVFEDFCRSFQAAFSEYLGSTIKDVSIGLGPGGELRYPSVPADKKQPFAGVGQFQCYDANMLKLLQEQADRSGNHMWGLSGPHDAPRYEESPEAGSFFREKGGSWETPYGDFFLSWYSSQLLAHGDRMLSMASRVFSGIPVTVSAKVPSMHSWFKTRSHAAELTAGYYNTDRRDGYDAVAEMFARNSCRMIVPGMELLDKHQPRASRASPESLQAQILGACKRHGVRVFGENCAVSQAAADGLAKIKASILDGESPVEAFAYQRMGVHLFSPEHWPHFVEFVRSIDRVKLEADDLPSEDGKPLTLGSEKVAAAGSKSMEMQAA